MEQHKVAVVDGSNVAFEERSKGGDPKVSNLVALRKLLQEQGFQVIIIVDAALRHQVDDAGHLEALVKDQTVRQAPAGTDADFFVLKTAEDLNAIVVANDRYKHFHKQFPWIEKRRLPFMIINGLVELYQASGPGKR